MYEDERLQALFRYNVLDTPHEDDFNEIVTLASSICDTPISLISLVDHYRQWFKAKVGLEANETSREISFCSHAIMQDDIFVVNDATKDARFVNNPLVTGNPDIRFYAGMPLVAPDGYKLGTLCVIDRVPRDLGDSQKKALRTLSHQVIKLLELRLNVNYLQTYAARIQEQKKELESLNHFKDRVFSVVSHDLSTPISNIHSLLVFFEDGDFTEAEMREQFKKLGANVSDTVAMLDNLLSWSRNQFKGAITNPITIQLNEIVSREADLFRVKGEKKGVRISNMLGDGLHVYADPDAMRIVFRNLISNAIKFCRAGDTITIAADHSTDGNKVEVSIQDSGTGMAPELLDKLFKDKEHITTYGTSNEKGTGLGLLLCKELIEQNGGSIWCSSEPGKGSTFYVTLPVIKALVN